VLEPVLRAGSTPSRPTQRSLSSHHIPVPEMRQSNRSKDHARIFVLDSGTVYDDGRCRVDELKRSSAVFASQDGHSRLERMRVMSRKVAGMQQYNVTVYEPEGAGGRLVFTFVPIGPEQERGPNGAPKRVPQFTVAARLEAFMATHLRKHPEGEGVHYSDLFEQFLPIPIADEPRRILTDWLPEYFYKPRPAPGVRPPKTT
jgi:hypothetical protein